MAVKPFQLILSENKKDEKRIQLPREVDGILWAELKPNLGGDYGYKDETFIIKILYATGVVTDKHKWLLGVLDSPEDIFEIQHKKANGKTDKGWTNWEATPEEDQIKERWADDGSLVAILCDDIPQLAMLAEFAVNKLIYKDDGYTVYHTKNPSKELFSEIATEIVEKQDSSYSSSRLNKKHKEFLKDNSWFFLLNTQDDVDASEDETLGTIFQITYEEDFIKAITVNWSEPEIKETAKRSWGGSKGQTEKEVIQDRVSSALELFKVATLEELSSTYGIPEVNLKMSLILGNTFNLHIYDSYIGSEEKLETPKLIEQPTIAAVGKEEPKNGHKPEAENSMWISLILDLKEERAFPKEVDIEFLKERGSAWCGRFYTVLAGKINGFTPYGKERGEARKVTSFIHLKFDKKALFELSVEELGEIISMPEFESQRELTEKASS